jgi:Gluconate 2-dehydrogenase subunit 3
MPERYVDIRLLREGLHYHPPQFAESRKERMSGYNTPLVPGTMSRRRFVAGTIRLAAVSPLLPFEAASAVVQPGSRLGNAEQRTLRAAANVVIPAEGRMPSASAVGAVKYVERVARTDPRLHDLLLKGLRAIEASAAETDGRRFDLLTGDQKTQLLAAVEKSDSPAGFFPTLRDLVYEAYYTQPRVMKLIGYNLRTGRRRTAALEAFDDQPLARVRTRAPFYRTVTS